MAFHYSDQWYDSKVQKDLSLYGPSTPLDMPVPEYTESDAERLFGTPPPYPAQGVQKLYAPVTLPQIATNYDAAFLRAYNPTLVDSGIFEDDWLRFIDGLNVAITASPPLRVIDMAGLVLGFVPYHWAIIAGAVMQTTAQTAAHILSKTLTDRYLLRANKTYFEPRGLKVRLMKTAAMRRFVHVDDSEEEKSKWKQFGKTAGRTAETIGLRLPIANRLITAFAKPAPKIDPNSPSDVSFRRLQQLDGFVMPMWGNVPPARLPEGLLDKTSALAIKLEQWRAKRRDTKAMRSRQLLAITEGRAPLDSLINPNRRERRQERYAVRHAGRRRGPIGGVLSLVGIERGNRRTRRLASKVAAADRLEMLNSEGLIWLVLFNADEDKIIEGTHLVDTDAPETIEDSEWEDIIDEENKHDADDAIELLELNKDYSSASSSTNPFLNDTKKR